MTISMLVLENIMTIKSISIKYVEKYIKEFSWKPTRMVYDLCKRVVHSDKKWNFEHHKNTKNYKKIFYGELNNKKS